MPKNLGEISELKDGLNGLYQFVTAYQKIKKVTNDTIPVLDSIELFYLRNKETLKNLEKQFDDL